MDSKAVSDGIVDAAKRGLRRVTRTLGKVWTVVFLAVVVIGVLVVADQLLGRLLL